MISSYFTKTTVNTGEQHRLLRASCSNFKQLFAVIKKTIGARFIKNINAYYVIDLIAF